MDFLILLTGEITDIITDNLKFHGYVDMDEDDFQRLMEREYKQCPYYKDGDEYKVVRHQI